MTQTVSRVVVTSVEKDKRDELGEPELLTGTFYFFSKREM